MMSKENKSFIFGLFLAVFIGFAASIIGLLPRAGSMVVMISNPLSEKEPFAIVAQAGGLFVSDLSSSVAIALVEENKSSNFVSKLYQNGAFLVLDAEGFLACFNPELLSLFHRKV